MLFTELYRLQSITLHCANTDGSKNACNRAEYFFAFYQDFIIMLPVAIKMYAWSIVWGFSSGHGDVSYNTLLYGLVDKSIGLSS